MSGVWRTAQDSQKGQGPMQQRAESDTIKHVSKRRKSLKDLLKDLQLDNKENRNLCPETRETCVEDSHY